MIAAVALAGWVLAGTATQWAPAPAPPPAEGEARPGSGGVATEPPPAEGAVKGARPAPPPSEGPASPSTGGATTAPPPSEGPPSAEGPTTPSSGGAATAPPPSEASPPGGATEPIPPGGSAGPGAVAEGSVEAPQEAPAPLPPQGPPPPKPSEPRAWGGAFGAPLPQPPAAADPSSLTAVPWRGRVWIGVGLAASFPLGGQPPAAGTVIAMAAEASLGVRLNRFLALHTSVSSFAHDAAQRMVAVPDGNAVAEVELGRITAFDLVTARVFAPVHRRIEPWAEVGVGVGSRRGPFALERQAAGLVRVGVGVDFWLAPTLTLGASTVYRTIILGDAVGHGLRAGADFGVHW